MSQEEFARYEDMAIDGRLIYDEYPAMVINRLKWRNIKPINLLQNVFYVDNRQKAEYFMMDLRMEIAYVVIVKIS